MVTISLLLFGFCINKAAAQNFGVPAWAGVDSGILTKAINKSDGARINDVFNNNITVNIIASMQGSILYPTNNKYLVSASTSFENIVRFNGLAPASQLQVTVTFPLIRINASFADLGGRADPTVVYFNDPATTAFDPDYDALKLMNTDPLVPNLYAIASDATRLSICAWPALRDRTETIPLGLRIKQAGWITFNATARERIPGGWDTYLFDAETNTYLDLWRNPKYRLYLETGNYDNRFSFVCSLGPLHPNVIPREPPASPAPATESDKLYNINANLLTEMELAPGEKCLVTVTNKAGQVILSRRLDKNGIRDLKTKLKNGIYIITLQTNKQLLSNKIIIGN